MAKSLSFFSKIIILLILTFNDVLASDDPEKSMSLQEQIDAQKQEMIELGRDIKILENVLLYPKKSRVSIFLTMDIAKLFSLEKVKLLLNGKLVGEYVYSAREVTGFGKGSAHRLFIGNLEDGKYKITAIFNGKGPRGRAYKRAVSGLFVKEGKQKIFEISVEDDVSKQQPAFYIRDVS